MIPLSICTIYPEGEEEKLGQFIENLPKGIELCLVKTQPIKNAYECAVALKFFETQESDILVKRAIYPWYTKEGDYWHGFSFAHARNRSLQLATRKFILILDLDEILVWEPGKFEQVFKVLNEKLMAGYVTITSHYFPHNKDMCVESGRVIRLLINDKRIEYAGRCHEQILPSLATIEGNNQPLLYHSDIVIVHNGYFDSNINRWAAKMVRNAQLLIKDLAEEPSGDIIRYTKLFNALMELTQCKIIPLQTVKSVNDVSIIKE